MSAGSRSSPLLVSAKGWEKCSFSIWMYSTIPFPWWKWPMKLPLQKAAVGEGGCSIGKQGGPRGRMLSLLWWLSGWAIINLKWRCHHYPNDSQNLFHKMVKEIWKLHTCCYMSLVPTVYIAVQSFWPLTGETWQTFKPGPPLNPTAAVELEHSLIDSSLFWRFHLFCHDWPVPLLWPFYWLVRSLWPGRGCPSSLSITCFSLLGGFLIVTWVLQAVPHYCSKGLGPWTYYFPQTISRLGHYPDLFATHSCLFRCW